MKPIPEHILAKGPPGTSWTGGSVDRSTMTLRVMAKERGGSVDNKEISKLLGCETDRENHKGWCLHAPMKEEADLDSQVEWIFNRVSRDPAVWKKISEGYRLDLFCGLFMERSNRGATLSPETMSELGARGIQIGFDIYSPES